MFNKIFLINPGGISEDGIPRYVIDQSGNLTATNVNLTGEFNNVKSIEDFNYAFYNTSVSGNITFPKLKKVYTGGMESTFYGCSSITSASFPKLTTIGNRGLSGAFSSSSLTTISFPSLVSIGTSGMDSTFYYCRNLNGTIEFPSLETIGQYGMETTFLRSSVTKLYFPKLVNIDSEAFGDLDSVRTVYASDSVVTEIHFRGEVENTVKSLPTYGYKFGYLNATIYFDLGMVYVNIVPNISGTTTFFNGATCSNPLEMFSNMENKYYVYKSGYCVYIGSKTPSFSDEGNTLTENITMTTSGYTTTLSITVPAHSRYTTTNLTIDYIIDGTTIYTDTKNNISTTTNTTQTSTSIKVPSNTTITYRIKAKGYETVTGTLIPSNNTVSITLVDPHADIIELSYPFTSNTSYLANLVDNTNFAIYDTTQTPPSCIASIGSSLSTGYIRFTTPNTDDEELLTMSLTVADGARYAFSYGAVYINTTGNLPTSVNWNGEMSDHAGTTNSYGLMLFTGRDGSSSTAGVFSTITKQLSANTTYYLCFYYGIASSSPWGYDKLAISNIKLPVTTV